ncbi:MAG: MmcQ/YjbR family DNA-binding protein [Myxococcales bacterium]|nr:MmcQ/YjbR family DNA-binding protein [Myxococcales bacterium]
MTKATSKTSRRAAAPTRAATSKPSKRAGAATATPAAKARPAAKAKPATPARVSTHPPKVRTAATLALIDRLRAICVALPDVTEQVAWAEPTWRVGGKMFAMCDTYHHGSAHLSVHLPAPPGAQAALIDADPARFFRPPYVGSKGWVAVVLDTAPDWEMVAALVRTAYELIAPRRRR